MAQDIAKLKLDDFKTYVNGDFAVQIGIDKAKKPVLVTLKLDQAKSTGPEVHGGRPGGSFSLHFVGEDSRLKQGTYPVTHGKLGTMEIFLVPAGPGASGHGYHAVFG